jgi:hypothetical protein
MCASRIPAPAIQSRKKGRKLREAEARLVEAVEEAKSDDGYSSGFGFGCERVDETGGSLIGTLQWLIPTLCVITGLGTVTIAPENWIVTLVTAACACCCCTMSRGPIDSSDGGTTIADADADGLVSGMQCR